MLLTTNPLDKFLGELGVFPKMPDESLSLYHFTGQVAASAICQGDIRCFNSSQMSDPNEFQLGRMFMMLNPHRKMESYAWEELCADAERNVRCWTFSLCNPNETNRKQMFMKFCCGKPGGPAIVLFDLADLHAKVSEQMCIDMSNLHMPQSMRCYHFLLPCLYASQDKAAISKLLSFLFGPYLKQLEEAYGNKLNARELAFACSYIFRAIVKADQYKGEKEYRLIIITFDGSNDRSRSFGINYRPKLVSASYFCDCPC